MGKAIWARPGGPSYSPLIFAFPPSQSDKTSVLEHCAPVVRSKLDRTGPPLTLLTACLCCSLHGSGILEPGAATFMVISLTSTTSATTTAGMQKKRRRPSRGYAASERCRQPHRSTLLHKRRCEIRVRDSKASPAKGPQKEHSFQREYTVKNATLQESLMLH
eukprot:gene17858-biopygen5377